MSIDDLPTSQSINTDTPSASFQHVSGSPKLGIGTPASVSSFLEREGRSQSMLVRCTTSPAHVLVPNQGTIPINIGGRIFDLDRGQVQLCQTLWSAFAGSAATSSSSGHHHAHEGGMNRLRSSSRVASINMDKEGRIYVDRDPALFDIIRTYLRNPRREFVLPKGFTSYGLLVDEIEFYGLKCKDPIFELWRRRRDRTNAVQNFILSKVLGVEKGCKCVIPFSELDPQYVGYDWANVDLTHRGLTVAANGALQILVITW